MKEIHGYNAGRGLELLAPAALAKVAGKTSGSSRESKSASTKA